MMNSLIIPTVKDKTVVIADDDEIMCALLRGALRSIGMQVVDEARDGVGALAAIQKHKPQIVCLDIDMPEMDGLAVLAKIRETDRDVIVLMISAATTEGNVRQALASRADGVILKPFSAAKIVKEVEQALARRLRQPA